MRPTITDTRTTTGHMAVRGDLVPFGRNKRGRTAVRGLLTHQFNEVRVGEGCRTALDGRLRMMPAVSARQSADKENTLGFATA
jgi:hypothetical protein